MSRLTVVIPALNSTSALESSLVSALEHRPQGCDVIVALREPYADPYELAGEVRFLEPQPDADLAAMIRAGVAAAESDYVFVLLAGCEVTAGWSDMALKHFANPRVAAVTPTLARATDPVETVCQGVRLLPGGERWVHPGPAPLGDELLVGVWAPPLAAGFYRRAALLALDAFGPECGGPLADLRLAAAMRRNRWLVAWAPTSVVACEESAIRPIGSRVRLAWNAQRLAADTADMFGRGRSMRGAWRSALAEFLRTLPSPVAFALVAVRLLALLSSVRRSGEIASPTAAAPRVGAPGIAPQPPAPKSHEQPQTTRRVDASHTRDRREQVSHPLKQR